LTRIIFVVVSLTFARQFTFPTGGAINPAIVLGLGIINSIVTGDGEPFANFWIFLAGEFAGAFAAGFFFNFYHHYLQVD